MGPSEDVSIGGCRAAIQGLWWQNFSKEDGLYQWSDFHKQSRPLGFSHGDHGGILQILTEANEGVHK